MKLKNFVSLHFQMTFNNLYKLLLLLYYYYITNIKPYMFQNLVTSRTSYCILIFSKFVYFF